MIQNAANDIRLNFNTAVREIARANNVKESDVNLEEVTQGYLWTEATLSPNTSFVQFPVIDTQQVANSPVTPTMRLLTMQDSFLVSALSYFAMIYAIVGGDATKPDFTSADTWQPVTYPSKWYNNGSGTDFDPGMAILWIGAFLSLEVNKKVLIPYWDCYRHYKAPGHQAATGMFTPNWFTGQYNEHDGSVDGFYPVEPNIVIGGGRGNILKANYATNIPGTINPFIGAGYGETHILKAVVCVRGILMQNSTAVK